MQARLNPEQNYFSPFQYQLIRKTLIIGLSGFNIDVVPDVVPEDDNDCLETNTGSRC